MIRRITIFLILLNVIFFAFGISFKSQASIDVVSGINVYIIKSSNSYIDYEDIHVELMVLKSDFHDDYIMSTINEIYQMSYPNYLSYSHLEDDTEISYLAYIYNTFMYKESDKITYSDDYGFLESITYLRLVMFTSDGTILARSELYMHTDRYDSGSRDVYHANFDNYTFSQTVQEGVGQSFEKLILFIFLIGAGAFIGAVLVIWLAKVGLSALFKVKYIKQKNTKLTDILFIFFGLAIGLHYHIKVFNREFLSSALFSTLIFLIWNATNYFTLVEKESRKKYLIVTLILYVFFSLLILIILKFLIE